VSTKPRPGRRRASRAAGFLNTLIIALAVVLLVMIALVVFLVLRVGG
jgi:heme/copper-type cytochrome/quinol oxidase subunit 2